MDLRTYRASSLQEALRLVREDLGPDASLLHTRNVEGGISRWLGGANQIEVTASAEVRVPSRLEGILQPAMNEVPAADIHDYRSKFRADLLREHRRGAALDEIYYDKSLADEICVSGPIRGGGARPRVVAFVGPTGVGKTTSIAKLAARFALQQECSVGLITVDTYRIAAVEQLRTYAEIMDLPLEVVSSPREARQAVQRLGDLDLILMDTAGRSPRDEIRIAELQMTLAEAAANEIVLVLSAAAGIENCLSAAETFSRIGVTSLLLTKLDEAVSLHGLLPLFCNPRLPLCYVTDGQSVPDDISPADARRLAARIMGAAGDPRPTRDDVKSLRLASVGGGR